MPSASQSGKISLSTSRVHREYSICKAASGCTACARRTVAAPASHKGLLRHNGSGKSVTKPIGLRSWDVRLISSLSDVGQTIRAHHYKALRRDDVCANTFISCSLGGPIETQPKGARSRRNADGMDN